MVGKMAHEFASRNVYGISGEREGGEKAIQEGNHTDKYI